MSAALLPLGEALRRISWPVASDAGDPIIRTAENGKKYAINTSTGETSGLGPEIDGKKADGGAVGEASKTFADDLEKSLAGKLAANEPLRMGKTSEALKLAGAGDLPVVMSQGKAKEVMAAGDHGLSKETLLSIPKQLHDPIMVLDSSTQANSLVVVTELFDKGKPVVAAVHLNKQSRRMEVNEVASVYGRSGAAGFLEREIGAGKLRYINKSKSSTWSRGLSGLQLPAVMQHAKRFDGKKIHTERDLVKESLTSDSVSLTRRHRLLDGLKELLVRNGLAKDDEWITMKGSHVLLGEGGEVKAGAGGKFTGQNIHQLKAARNAEALKTAQARLAAQTPQQMLNEPVFVRVGKNDDPGPDYTRQAWR